LLNQRYPPIAPLIKIEVIVAKFPPNKAIKSRTTTIPTKTIAIILASF